MSVGLPLMVSPTVSNHIEDRRVSDQDERRCSEPGSRDWCERRRPDRSSLGGRLHRKPTPAVQEGPDLQINGLILHIHIDTSGSRGTRSTRVFHYFFLLSDSVNESLKADLGAIFAKIKSWIGALSKTSPSSPKYQNILTEREKKTTRRGKVKQRSKSRQKSDRRHLERKQESEERKKKKKEDKKGEKKTY
ncbi:hypothetical protein CEXT_163561 [Caerostris extrusa]|uniref:Uncharacterized protein n=1 Tax=Caerostris extrusa TaxID=172846 RepID=A0AAV4PTA1_CAEEX|nr:hypothetical protein CEXT_163561 [Caerostris extrusa]